MKTIYHKYGGYFLEELCNKCGILGATRRVLGAKDYRMSLTFLLQVMEGGILMQLKMYREYCHLKGCNSEFIRVLDTMNWEDAGDKRSIGK